MSTEIESQIRDFLAKNIVYLEDCGTLADDASLLAEGVIDSIGVMELVEYVHKQFGIEVPLHDLVPANFDSISRVAAYVRRRLAEMTSASPRFPAGAEALIASIAPPVAAAWPADGPRASAP